MQCVHAFNFVTVRPVVFSLMAKERNLEYAQIPEQAT